MKKMLNNKLVDMTADEIKLREAEEKTWTDEASTRSMARLRKLRDELLAETDWMANSDVTMSDAWKKYRQDLRDITKQTPSDDTLSNITFPTKPS